MCNDRTGCTALAAMLVLGLGLGRAWAASLYTLLDLGTINGDATVGRAVNDAGQVAGFSTPQGAQQAFRTIPNAPINVASDLLGTLGGKYSQAYGLNATGQAVGFSAVGGAYHGFRTGAGAKIDRYSSDLGTLSGRSSSYSMARAINSAGQVVGWSDNTAAEFWPARAFRTAANQPINPTTDDLGTLGGNFSDAYAINSTGQVVGLAELAGDKAHHAFRTAAGAAINSGDDLGTLGGTNSAAFGINDSGVVVGEAQVAGDSAYRGFRTAPNSAINPATDQLSTLGGRNSRATAINDSGTVVGNSDMPDGSSHGFLYDGSTVQDLNGLMDASLGWTVIEAWSINNNCQIAGVAIQTGSSIKHAVLLSPASGTCAMPDLCPNDPTKTAPGQCGCGVPDTDTDNDGAADCIDGCPTDPNKIAPGGCGCGVPDTDSDGDGVPDCIDLCPNTPPATIVDANGCPIRAAADFDADGYVNQNDLNHLSACITGPGVPQTVTSCVDTDLDKDGDTDQDDFGIFQRCYSGTTPADLNCDQ